MPGASVNTVFEALEGFRIELASWGFSDTDTRFGRYPQECAAANIAEKFVDAGLAASRKKL